MARTWLRVAMAASVALGISLPCLQGQAAGKGDGKPDVPSDKYVETAFSPDGKLVLTGTEREAVFVWDAATGRKQWSIAVPSGEIKAATFTPDGRTIVATCPVPSTGKVRVGGEEFDLPSTDCIVMLWDVQTRKERAKFVVRKRWLRRLAVTRDGSLLLATSFGFFGEQTTAEDEGEIRLIDLREGVQVGELRGHRGVISVHSLSADGRQLATGSDDEPVRVWDLRSRKCVHRLNASFHSPYSGSSFSSDTHTLVTSGNDYFIRVWDVATGKERRRIGPFRRTPRDIQFVPQTRLVTAWVESGLQFWDTETGKEVKPSRPFEVGWHFAISADGRRVATVLDDELKLGDLADILPKK